MSGKSPSRSLSCPRCGLEHEPDERFCGACGMPLVAPGATVEPVRGEAHLRARRIASEYTHGELVRVAGGRNQAEAELIQNLLLAEGIPSIVRRSAGFDVPDYLAGGPRDVLVAESAVEAAHQMLLDTDLAPQAPGPERARSPLRTAAVVLAVVAGALLFVYLLWLAVPSG